LKTDGESSATGDDCSYGWIPTFFSLHEASGTNTRNQNSLDIMPNDLEDVTRAIADRYGRDKAKSYLAGRAFTAPREHVAMKSLPQPLVPTQAPLQPRKSSTRKKSSIRTRGSGKARAEKTKKSVFDLASLNFGGGGQEDPRDATPDRRKELWAEQQVEHNLVRRGSSITSVGERSKKGSKTAREMLKELESFRK